MVAIPTSQPGWGAYVRLAIDDARPVFSDTRTAVAVGRELPADLANIVALVAAVHLLLDCRLALDVRGGRLRE